MVDYKFLKNLKKLRAEYILIIILLVFTFVICALAFIQGQHKYLKLAFLDIGQGDAIYVEAPNGKQMLIDGGSGRGVLLQLRQVMPFGDHSIDMLVITNPDHDHDAGFIDVLNNYDVKAVLEPGTYSPTKTYAKLEQLIKDKNVQKEIARRGMKILLDKEKNISFDILFPDRDVSNFSRNDGSIVGKIVYGKESFMMMGDATAYTESIVARNETPEILNANVLKLGHHGSRTSSSSLWLETVHPELAIISAGLHNRYGHPHKEVLDRLMAFHIPYLGTYQKGTIVCNTDGVLMNCK